MKTCKTCSGKGWIFLKSGAKLQKKNGINNKSTCYNCWGKGVK